MHTPGPWKYHKTHPLSGTQWFVICDSKGYGPIMDIGGSDFAWQIAEAKYLITDPQEIESNARLIAAAPDLLAALKDVSIAYQEMFDAMPVAWATIDNIVQAVIAKAEGRE